MTQPPTPRREPLDASLELLAEALCHDAQVRGYDHGANPTLMSYPPKGPAYCPRHLGMAQSVRYSLSKGYVEPDEAEAVRQALSELEEEVGGLPERGASRLHGKLVSVEEVIELIHKKGAEKGQ